MQQPSRVYEDFEPTSDWLRDIEQDTLLVYLPGFRKEQVKVVATSSQKLRILGERSVGENKWSRLRLELPISSNYDSDKISARFQDGVLHVKHPKKINNAPAAEQQQPAKTSMSSQNQSAELPQPLKIEQNDGSQQQVPPKLDPDNGVADGGTSKPAAKDQPEKTNSKKNPNDGLVEEEEGKNTVGKHGNADENMNKKAETNSDSGKCKLGCFGQALATLMAEMKQPRQSAILLLASLIVLVIGIYAKTIFGFRAEAES